MGEVRLFNLLKQFGSQKAVDDITYSFKEGQVTCLLGPSGCGKTTLLRMIAGLETPTSGKIFIGDVDVTKSSVQSRKIGMVFQYPVVYRGLSVYDNIELPLRSARLGSAERRKRVEEAIELVQLKDICRESVDRIDGVSKQKTAVAREVARKPTILLFDEPLTNVDASAKYKFLRAFKALTNATSQTIIYVTHDQTEAMTLADQIALMQDGRIAQCDRPRVVYSKPSNEFAGWFLGNPGINFVPGNAGTPEASESLLLRRMRELTGRAAGGESLTFGIRAENVLVSAAPRPDFIEASVERNILAIGGQMLITLGVEGQRIKAKIRFQEGIKDAKRLWLGFPPEAIILFQRDQQIGDRR
jgi:ABC-type sugar transport system ATPase subunit